MGLHLEPVPLEEKEKTCLRQTHGNQITPSGGKMILRKNTQSVFNPGVLQHKQRI